MDSGSTDGGQTTTRRGSTSSPGERQQDTPQHKLSSSLKERLRRSRRTFTSPFSVAKRLCVDDLGGDGQQVSADPQETVNKLPLIKHSVDVNRNEVRSRSEGFSGHVPDPTGPPSPEQLRKEVKDKMEAVRRLRMVQTYRNKNDLTQLQHLIDKWRSCAQAALCELQADGRTASLSELIDLFGLDDRILHFDRTEQDFTS